MDRLPDLQLVHWIRSAGQKLYGLSRKPGKLHFSN